MPDQQRVAEIAADKKELARQLYIRICRDSGFKLNWITAAHLAATCGEMSALEVWMALPDMDTMRRLADGSHPALVLPHYQTVRTHLESGR